MAFRVLERDLYNGKYHLVHNPLARGRQARYTINGTDKPKGVTTILGATLSKDLMQWAVDSAMIYLQAKIPLVTKQDLEIAAVEYIRLRDAGGSTGSEAHEMAEQFLMFVSEGKEGAFVPKLAKEPSQDARNAFNAFAGWYYQTTPRVIGVEESIYSPTYNYCGTYDAIMEIGGKVYLCDLKTTNVSRKAPRGIYAEHFIQMGAYALAYLEQREFEDKNGGTKLLEIDDLMLISAKKNGALDVVAASDLGLSVGTCIEMFRNVINIYHFMTDVTEKLGGK
jgi:hypothetical protein